jgi:8-oxo-dGTP diphosphatase
LKTVYTVAFKDGKFLMVFNPERNGWEMPGGKIEKNEDVKDAAIREFLEESGYEVDIVSVRNLNHCWVCSARLKDKVSDSEMESELFETLPDELFFDKKEYDEVIPWALKELNK